MLRSDIEACASPVSFPISTAQISLETFQGFRLLEESPHKENFFKLIRYFTSQQNTGFCGIASAVIVLNRLGFEGPDDEDLKPYKLITQNNIFHFLKHVSWLDAEKIRLEGLNLEQLAFLLQEIGAHVSISVAPDLTLCQFRKLVLHALDKGHKQVILNYSRGALNQDGYAHFSPVAAYHQETDRFLVLDVAPFKYPSLWIRTIDLYQALNTRGTDGTQRGLIILHK